MGWGGVGEWVGGWDISGVGSHMRKLIESLSGNFEFEFLLFSSPFRKQTPSIERKKNAVQGTGKSTKHRIRRGGFS